MVLDTRPNLLIGIQARTRSTRLPNKAMKTIGDKTLLQMVYETCASIPTNHMVHVKTVVLTPFQDPLVKYCKDQGWLVYDPECDSTDLVKRYQEAMKFYNASFLVRITADCPLLEKQWLERVLEGLMNADYVTNTMFRTALDGHDVQGITKKAFDYYANRPSIDREHVFLDIEQDYKFRKMFTTEGFKITNLVHRDKVVTNPYLPQHKLSVDTENDLERLRKAYERVTSTI